jgi:hypothetical protein
MRVKRTMPADRRTVNVRVAGPDPSRKVWLVPVWLSRGGAAFPPPAAHTSETSAKSAAVRAIPTPRIRWRPLLRSPPIV